MGARSPAKTQNRKHARRGTQDSRGPRSRPVWEELLRIARTIPESRSPQASYRHFGQSRPLSVRQSHRVKRLFADTVYSDRSSPTPSTSITREPLDLRSLESCRLLAADLVLIEFLNALADNGRNIRTAAVQMVEAIMNNPQVTVAPIDPAYLHTQSRTVQGSSRHRLPSHPCSSILR